MVCTNHGWPRGRSSASCKSQIYQLRQNGRQWNCSASEVGGCQHLGTDTPRARVAKLSSTRCHSPFLSSPLAVVRNEREASKEIMNPMQKHREQFAPILTLFTAEIEGIVCCSKVLITQPWESKPLMCLEGIKHSVKIKFPSVFWCLSIRQWRLEHGVVPLKLITFLNRKISVL